jgi:hypothetical protein
MAFTRLAGSRTLGLWEAMGGYGRLWEAMAPFPWRAVDTLGFSPVRYK